MFQNKHDTAIQIDNGMCDEQLVNVLMYSNVKRVEFILGNKRFGAHFGAFTNYGP